MQLHGQQVDAQYQRRGEGQEDHVQRKEPAQGCLPHGGFALNSFLERLGPFRHGAGQILAQFLEWSAGRSGGVDGECGPGSR